MADIIDDEIDRLKRELGEKDAQLRRLAEELTKKDQQLAEQGQTLGTLAAALHRLGGLGRADYEGGVTADVIGHKDFRQRPNNAG
ncbi:hypothetical protein FRC06_009695 [Ceratobasidium sp. 370]|nr:hypothetical protein FRC06_009695 [Ceratobasidium sp. 370]